MPLSSAAPIQASDSYDQADKASDDSAAAAKSTEHVILLHGLCRTMRCMNRLDRTLSADGYTVHNIGYQIGRATCRERV